MNTTKRLLLVFFGCLLSILLVLLYLANTVTVSASGQTIVGNLPFQPMSASKISDTKYEMTYDKQTTKVTIGDDTVFKPKVKVSKWDLAHSFTFEVTGLGTFEPIFDAVTGKLKAKHLSKDFSIEYSQTPVLSGFNEDGGLDIVITIGKKTDLDGNSITFTLTTDHIVGYPQPPLTPQAIADGATQPGYVVNSIAFYCTDQGGYQLSGGIEWKTGKIGHLYRMKVVGKDGTWAWMDWSISENILTLTDTTGYIAAQSSNNSNYPLIIKPVADTFGYTTVGANTIRPVTGNYVVGQVGTPASSGDVDDVKAYIVEPDAGHFKGLVVDEAGLLILESGGADCIGSVATNSSTPSWKTSSFSTKPSVTASTAYVPCVVVDANITFYYDSGGSGNQRLIDSTNSYTTPADLGTGVTRSTARYSIYADYTPTPTAADITNAPASKAFGALTPAATYWANGSSPTWPMADGECYWTITNNSAFAIDLYILGSNFTGGVGATLVTGSPGTDEVNLIAFPSGAATTTSGVTLNPNSTTVFKTNVASSTTLKWELEIVIGTPTDGAAKTGTFTISAIAH